MLVIEFLYLLPINLLKTSSWNSNLHANKTNICTNMQHFFLQASIAATKVHVIMMPPCHIDKSKATIYYLVPDVVANIVANCK